LKEPANDDGRLATKSLRANVSGQASDQTHLSEEWDMKKTANKVPSMYTDCVKEMSHLCSHTKFHCHQDKVIKGSIELPTYF